MKSDLILKKFTQTTDYGTKNLNPHRSFFGTVLMDIEDEIIIDDSSISYSELYQSEESVSTNGYQYYDLDTMGIGLETTFSAGLTDVKAQNHTVKLFQQSKFVLETNTNWEFNIDIKSILRKYLFLKIKNRRTFKCLKGQYFKSGNINTSIYEYIDSNLINRYGFEKVDFYIKYFDIKTNQIYLVNTLIQLNPIFDIDVYNSENLNSDVNVLSRDNFENLKDLTIRYNQIKPSDQYKFNYYFNIYYKKI